MKKVISILLILVIISCKGEKASINNDNNYFLEFIQQTDQYIYLYKIDRNNPLKLIPPNLIKEFINLTLAYLNRIFFSWYFTRKKCSFYR